MPVFEILGDTPFPDPRLAEPDGLLAFGAEISVPRLLEAYPLGIFPWYNPGEVPMWWAPHDRCVLFPELMHCSKNLRRIIRNNRFELRIDSAFEAVLNGCATVGENRANGTWLSPELKACLLELHRLGIAHSIESWRDGVLVGGLYGISIGSMFFGESMFAAEPEASKVAFYHLSQWMMAHDMDLIDCQIPNDHLISLGAQVLPRAEFYSMLKENVNKSTIPGPWKLTST